MKAIEANFDGLVGPSHNYGGLSFGNLASARNQGEVSRPKQAALQGLAKMKWLADAGLVQGVLPPHERPFLPLLRAAGFAGNDAQVYENAWRQAPGLAGASLSAAAMWSANAAMVSPSADTKDGRLHFMPANLSTMLHRSIEAEQTMRALRAAFPGDQHFAVHRPLPAHPSFADEGAANHVRLCKEHGAPGVELLVYGRDDSQSQLAFPARQTRQSVEAIARAHLLAPARTVLVQQGAKSIEAGAFHLDVVCVGTGECLFFHQYAFADKAGVLADIETAAKGLFAPVFVEVSNKDVPIADAIISYLFNSMLVQWPGEERLVLIAPAECRKTASVLAYTKQLVAGNGPIGRVEFVDVRQSMQNGGGPACLRLRVVLNEAQLQATNPKMLMNDRLFGQLQSWVNKHYRDELSPADLPDPALIDEGRGALDKLTGILGLGADFYPFQRD
ncbi:Succinylarginine dihydrolase [hydrothermal vent metagenome]|uniref:Succinylarginine dihydrolase n=1 Tax=hydrothermal vent metagenome TaxID=652676 RepID=A0A3B0RTV0_9ZZZZ